MDRFDPLDDLPDDDSNPWTIPLHGAAVPITSADAGPSPPATPPGPAAEVPPMATPFGNDIPTDIGFHPRLRRSA